MKNLFTDEGFDEIQNRLDRLTEHAEKQWGKMTVGQMAHHCQMPLNVILEKKDYGLKPNLLVKLFFKKSMYSDKPWRKNMPTVPKFKEVVERDFKKEKAALTVLLTEFESQRDRNDWKPHPAFGKLTKEQWGKMQYKHLDHHFRQFNI